MKTTSRWFGAGIAALSLGLAGVSAVPSARADSFDFTRSELLVERGHIIELAMHRGHAVLVVRRTVHNGGPRHDQATFHIDVPWGAVATGLRTLGSSHGRPHWFPGELMEAEAAAEKYRELTGIGGYYPKDPALLSWRGQTHLALQVFPCPPGQDKTVEYTLAVPTHYENGAYHLRLPALGTDKLTASIRARAAQPGDQLLVGGTPPPALIRPESGAELDFALVPSAAPVLGGELVQSEFAPGRVLTRYAAQAAPRLSRVPRGAYVALVVDASLSTATDFVDRAKIALDAYLSHFEDAHVELLHFDREVQRPFGKFLSVKDARLALSKLAVKRRNGSAVDLALAEADRLLAATPRSAPRRIVVVTDGLTRQGLTPERLRAATLTSGAVSHVGILGDGGLGLTRQDEHPWASALRHNRTLVWNANVPAGVSAKDAASVFEEWARPVRLHHFRMATPALDLQDDFAELPDELPEGEGVDQLLINEQAAPFVSVEAELWTEKVSTTIAIDKTREKLWSALVFGSPLLDSLSEPEMMTLAMRGGAVSPVTSYLAIEPGVRPSTEGLDHGFGIGSGRLGGSVKMGATRVSSHVQPIDREAFLQREFADGWRRCGGRPGEGSVTIETTSAEIANVMAEAFVDDALLARCLGEVAWDLVLPVQFTEEWNTFTIRV